MRVRKDQEWNKIASSNISNIKLRQVLNLSRSWNKRMKLPEGSFWLNPCGGKSPKGKDS